jgi:Uma2 family endonuclease
MLTQSQKLTTPEREQCFVLPGYYVWEQFEALEAVLIQVGGVRLTYLDGCIELMTLSEEHEYIKTCISFLLQLYFCEMGIEYYPVGSATRRERDKDVSFEPDESYYLGAQRVTPDLAIEVIMTSGSISKLEKYRRFQLQEVWFWENNTLTIYKLENQNYKPMVSSELLPDLDISLLVQCVLMPSRLEARKTFLAEISRGN